MMPINKVSKDLGTRLEISTSHQNSIDLKGSFSTQDIGTARLIFTIDKDNTALPLTSALTATIYLKGNNFVVQDICQVNRELSQISYLIDSDTIKHYGPVKGEIYIRYDQGQSLSVHKFHFRIDQALIDQDLEPIYQVYIRDLEDIKEEYLLNFENLEIELRQMLQDLRLEISALEGNSDTLSAKIKTLEQTLAAMDILKKSGDTAVGTINNTAESAFNVSYGYLRHYIGAQVAGTVVRMYIGYTGNWGSYVDIVVGETSIISNDDFYINPITPTTTYVTGAASINVTRTKSVINGVEKAASNTVNLKNVVESGRNGEIGFLKVNGANALTDAIVSGDDFNNILEFGRNYYISSSAKNAPLTLGTDTAGTASAYVRSANSIGQVYYNYNGRTFYRYLRNSPLSAYVTSKTDANGWVEFETTNGAQTKADKALSDATIKANTVETNSKAYTDSYFASKTIASNLAIYLSDTQSYTWNHSNMKKGLFIEVVRYTVGTGSNDYGYNEIFIPKDLIERRLGKACWFAMPATVNGEKKCIKFTLNGAVGTLTGYASNATSPDSGWAISNIRME
ncbi:BppU family phage baseplate upper protein [Listeria booriae]|uniref:BppU family phage baseplate upper protein n=1 Tax=Listeria booriae TaxID=1552123 RepID=A0A842AGD2_9LIST|nr:BppU family phage baseplate upper protein [Listeria booriae]MBC1615300.1 BppU family phage baseplate upper protein [Listeria booriae]